MEDRFDADWSYLIEEIYACYALNFQGMLLRAGFFILSDKFRNLIRGS